MNPRHLENSGLPKNASAEPTGFPETIIAGIGLNCVSGDQPFALLGTVGTDISGARPDPVIKVAVQGGQKEEPAMVARVADLEGIELPAERMEILAAKALSGAAASLPGDVAGEKILVCTLRPGEDCARGSALDAHQLEQPLRSLHPQLQAAEFRFIDSACGPTGQLLTVCNELAAGDWQAVLFGGVDSLVDTVSCHELALAGRLMTDGGTQGLIPGEAAAYLLLLPGGAEPAEKLAYIRGASQAEEPNTGKADCQPMTGLSTAIDQALSQSSCSVSALGGVIIPFGNEISSSLEWHQTTLKHWSPQPGMAESAEKHLPTAEPQAEPEVMSLHITCGDTGAAAFPLSLVLGCARFGFAHPQVDNILVCAAGGEPLRGALLLQE